MYACSKKNIIYVWAMGVLGIRLPVPAPIPIQIYPSPGSDP